MILPAEIYRLPFPILRFLRRFSSPAAKAVTHLKMD
jgi:hypothetical protein